MRLRVAVVGKGGVGKSLIAATLARVLARRGHRVLALDSDTLPGLAVSLGADVPREPPLTSAVERGPDDRWRFVSGVGPVRAVQRYATEAPDGVRLLQIGGTPRFGLRSAAAANNAFFMTISGLRDAPALRDWVIVGDLPGGPRQAAFGWMPYADRLLLVVEPTWQAMLTARRISRIALAARPGQPLCLVISKATGEDDARRAGAFLDLPVLAAVPADAAVSTAERLGVALLDHAPHCPAVRAIEGLADQLLAGSMR